MEKEQAHQGTKASSADILHNPTAENLVDPKWQDRYRALGRLRAAILARQRDLLEQAAEETTPPQRNSADRGTDQYDADWALGMASSEQGILYEIDEAMNRIRNGSYGTCELTGKPIAAERLNAIPWTRFTAEAEKRLEAEGQGPRARLGARPSIPKDRTLRGARREPT